MNFVFGFACFNPQEIKAINELIKKNLGQKEQPSAAAENINKVGESPSGLNIYKFNYITWFISFINF